MQSYRKYTKNKDRECGEELHPFNRDACIVAKQDVDGSSEDTCRSIEVRPKDKWRIIDKNVSNESSERACDRPHNDSDPPRIAYGVGLSYTNHHKQPKTNSIEEEERVIEPYHLSAEDDCKDQCQARDD